jgi:hypothetical protein
MTFYKTAFLPLFLLYAFSSYSQKEIILDSTVVITKIGISAKAGFNFATVSKGDLKNAPDTRTGFYVGVTYEIPIIDDIFSIQPEIIYSQQGFEKKYTLLGERYTSKYKVDYVTLPLLARYYIVRGFSLDAGPQFSLAINDEFDRDESDAELEFLTKSNTFDFGIAAGISFEFESGIFVNGRYNRGFREIIEDSKAKNAVIQFGLGYKF